MILLIKNIIPENLQNYYQVFVVALFCSFMLLPIFVNAQHSAHSEVNNPSVPLTEDDFYQLVTVPIPEGVILEVGGMAQLPDGRLAVTTRRGEVWIIENAGMSDQSKPYYKLFASGLHEPLGMAYKDGSFYIAQRAELTKLTDVNGDDKADIFETICTWPISGNYCEYNHGPIIGLDGNYYINFNLGDNGWFNREPFFNEMGGTAKWRGWMVKITPDGDFIPFATGLRSPAGIGMNAEGEIFYTENQGGWVGTGYIAHIEEGDFFGHPSGLKLTQDDPLNNIEVRISDIKDAVQNEISEEGILLHQAAERIPGLKMPSVRFPHGILGNSTAGFAVDNTEGNFGPFEGQLFVGDQGHANMMRVFLEKVNGAYQGAVFPFRQGFASGIIRVIMGNNYSLFVGMSDRGWNSTGPDRYGLQRLEWTGKTPFEMKAIRAMPDGFELEFTTPVDQNTALDAASYKITGFTYLYHMLYGSDVKDTKDCSIQGIKLSEDGLKARLIVDGLREGYIHEIKSEGVRSSFGTPLLHNFGYYTLNAIPSGTKLLLTDKNVKRVAIPETSDSTEKIPKEGKTESFATTPGVKPERKANTSAISIKEKNMTEMPSTWKNGPDITITVGTKPGLKFDLENFEVRPGAKVKLVFSNSDDMQHNLVVVQPNTANGVGEKALNLGLDGPGMDYVPQTEEVLFYTSLLQPRSMEAIYFTAPENEGEYQYICTVPGHYTLMRGIMKIIK